MPWYKNACDGNENLEGHPWKECLAMPGNPTVRVSSGTVSLGFLSSLQDGVSQIPV